MRMTMRPGEHIRVAADNGTNAFSVTIGHGFIHVVANEPGERSKVVISATESAEVIAGVESREERDLREARG